MIDLTLVLNDACRRIQEHQKKDLIFVRWRLYSVCIPLIACLCHLERGGGSEKKWVVQPETSLITGQSSDKIGM